MDWAKDQLGNVVDATQVSSFSYGLRCPRCLQPVFRKAGSYRRPHFSHFGYGGTLECEFYHPSDDAIVAPVAAPRTKLDRIEDIPAPWQLGGVFLRRTSIGGFALVLKMPQIPEASQALSGDIRVVTGLGTHVFSSHQLRVPQFVPIIPGLPVVQPSASESLRHVVDAIEHCASAFGVTGNYFRVGDYGSRLLPPAAPLELGESYWLITKKPLLPPSEDLGVTIVLGGIRRDWHYYEITLPFDANRIESSLARLLGRQIRASAHKAFFVEPPPHHIEADGTHVFPEGTSSVIVRKSPGARISEGVDGRSVRPLATIEEDGEWCRVSGLTDGPFSICVDGKGHLLGRIEPCRLFSPPGVVLGPTLVPLWNVEAAVIVQSAQIELKCPTMRVAQYVEGRNEGACREGSTVRLIAFGKRVSLVDAGNFGVISTQADKVGQPSAKLPQSQSSARRMWLEGVFRRHLSSAALTQFLSESPQRSAALAASFPETLWLVPHLQSIAGRSYDAI
jgi:hypothetical protein